MRLRKERRKMFSNKGRVLLVSAVIMGVASGCSMAPAGTGSEPSVNSTGGESEHADAQAHSTDAPAEGSGEAGASPEQAEPVDPADEDPLNVTANGAKLCSQQPPTGSSVFTILVHNATDEVFTLADVTLGSPEQLTLQSVQVTPANREGHHSSGDEDMDMDMEESEAPAPVGPVPATDYEIKTHDYVNVLVEVSIDENADRGSAAYVELDYSSEDRDYTAQHPLEIELTKEGCV